MAPPRPSVTSDKDLEEIIRNLWGGSSGPTTRSMSSPQVQVTTPPHNIREAPDPTTSRSPSSIGGFFSNQQPGQLTPPGNIENFFQYPTPENLQHPGGYTNHRDDYIAKAQERHKKEQASPFDDYLESMYAELSGAYDSQIEAYGGLADVYRNNAAQSQGNIGNFFGYAGDVARQGIPVTQDIYGTAQGNVDDIYDTLSNRLLGTPSGYDIDPETGQKIPVPMPGGIREGGLVNQMVDIASQAAGRDVGQSVADRVAIAAAPFAAAGETARADAKANLAQHSSAGQSYLNNLAGATGGEAALHQGMVEQALNQQLANVAIRQAEIEASKQKALMELSSDMAGESAERMADALLAQSLGLDIPQGVDPMDYLRGMDIMQGLGGEAADPLEQLEREVKYNRYMGELDPSFEFNNAVSSLSPSGQSVIQDLRSFAERETSPSGEPLEPREVGLKMLEVLDQMVSDAGSGNWGPEDGQINPVVMSKQLPEIQAAIRRLYGI